MALEITDVNTLFGAYPSQHADSTAETLVASMEAEQVNWCLTMSTWGLFHSDVDGNAETMRACHAHDHLIPVATFNPCGYWGQAETLAQFAGQAFEMFRFFPHEQNWPIDFGPFHDILSTLAQGPRMPIMVSVREPGDATLLGRAVADYPFPVILEGISSCTLTEAISVMRKNEKLYLETHALETPDGLPLLRDTVGIGRILFGSDAPGMALGAALRYVKRSALSDDDKLAVLGLNAQRIWQSGGGNS